MCLDICFIIQYHSIIRKRCYDDGPPLDFMMLWISVVMIKCSKMKLEYLTIHVMAMCRVIRDDN